MTLVTRNNLTVYQAGLKKSNWEQTEFRQFSLYNHPELKSYAFGLTAVANVSSTPEMPPGFSRKEDVSTLDDPKSE